MRFEYCCEGMKRGLGRVVFYKPMLNSIGTDCLEFRFCPFCGEKIEIDVTVKE